MIAENWVREGEALTKELFQSKTLDDKTGWYDFHARQYDPALGRWFAVDLQNQFMSPYLAMGNNPVVMVDPDGEFVVLGSILLGKIVAGALIGAGVGAASYSAQTAITGNSWNWRQFGKSIGMGAAGGALAGGVGQIFGGIGNFGHELARGVTHGVTQQGVGAAFGVDPSLGGFAAGVAGSMMGSGLQALKAPQGVMMGASSLFGGAVSELSNPGTFWQGVTVSGVASGANHAAHYGINKSEDSFLIRKKRREGLSSIDLSKTPYARVMKGMCIARLYNRGKLPMLDEQFPDGMRIQDLFDFSTATKESGWKVTGGNYGTRYWYQNKVSKIQLHGSSVRVGDVVVGNNEPYSITMYDNSDYMAFRRIGWVHYNQFGFTHWQKARNYIWYGK
ncbi:RHS repeat-associated core domain-containing protein [Echinicola pacifica]|nr:RHS repeat-associated core domain-containing protein [Echinicola pacifica]